MNATVNIQTSHRLWLLAAALVVTIAWAISWTYAQELRERPEPSEPRAEAPRERQGDDEGLGERRIPQERGDREGTPEGIPQTRIAPPGGGGRPHLLPNRWLLGVYARNTSTGVLVTRVQPHSPATSVGLEPNDLIVTVDGFQVGNVNGRLYSLGDELQHRAGANGRVRLMVQNWRDNQLVNLDVTLRRDADFYDPRSRSEN